MLTSIDVAIRDVAHIDARAERAHSTTATPVTVDVFYQDVRRWALDSNALVLENASVRAGRSAAVFSAYFVGDHNIVQPDVGAEDIDAIQTTLVGSSDEHVVHFSAVARIQHEVEGRCIH